MDEVDNEQPSMRIQMGLTRAAEAGESQDWFAGSSNPSGWASISPDAQD